MLKNEILKRVYLSSLAAVVLAVSMSVTSMADEPVDYSGNALSSVKSESVNTVHSETAVQTNPDVFAEANGYDNTDRVIDFYEVPELLDKNGKLAQSQQAQISAYTEAYSGVYSAYESVENDTALSCDERIEELQEAYKDSSDKDEKAAIKEEIKLLRKEKNRELKELSHSKKEAGDQENSRVNNVKRNLYNTKKMAANSYQGMIFDYKSMEYDEFALQKKTELYQAEYERTASLVSTGNATAADLNQAAQQLESSVNDLSATRNGMDSIKKKIGIGLGASVDNYRYIAFGNLPKYDLNYSETRNLETDIEAAYQQNYSMGQAYSIREKDVYGWNHKNITIDKTRKEIQISMENLLKAVREKRIALDVSVSS